MGMPATDVSQSQLLPHFAQILPWRRRGAWLGFSEGSGSDVMFFLYAPGLSFAPALVAILAAAFLHDGADGVGRLVTRWALKPRAPRAD